MIDSLIACLVVFGICLAGSEGTWFPWPNIVGCMLFVSAAAIILLTE